MVDASDLVHRRAEPDFKELIAAHDLERRHEDRLLARRTLNMRAQRRWLACQTLAQLMAPKTNVIIHRASRKAAEPLFALCRSLTGPRSASRDKAEPPHPERRAETWWTEIY